MYFTYTYVLNTCGTFFCRVGLPALIAAIIVTNDLRPGGFFLSYYVWELTSYHR